ncbi:ABC transporter substrate-binding protein [Stella sp.]|uniref:ABC transporter substrate-binding protein n=1 Tax=Stella sp. TaxID=2912054 RepID=UPI0035AFA539
MRRTTAAFVLAVSATVAGPAAAETVLDFPTYQLEESFGPWWRGLVDAYQTANPGVRIKLTNAPSNDHHRMLTTRFAAGNPPDIVHMTARFVWGFADEGVLEPLDLWMDKTDIKKSWVPSQASLAVGGKTYGLVLLNYGWGLVYNEAMLKAAGVTVPTTEPELFEAAKKLTRDRDGDGRMDQYGMALNTSSSTWGFMTFMHFHNGRDRDIVTDRKLDDVAEIARTLGRIQEYVKAGVTPTGLDNNPMRQLFWQGNAAMYIDGSWAPGYAARAAEAVKGQWRVAALPFPNLAGGPSNALAMPKDIPAERKALVWKFIELAASPDWQRRYAVMTGNPPGRVGSVDAEAREKWPTLPLFEASASRPSRSHLPIGFENDYNRFSSIFTEGMTAMVAGRLAPDAAARQIAAGLKREIKGLE